MNEAPVFVKITDYKDAVEVIQFIKDKLEEARGTLRKIEELKNKEDSELNIWNNSLGEIHRQIEQIERTLSEPEPI